MQANKKRLKGRLKGREKKGLHHRKKEEKTRMSTCTGDGTSLGRAKKESARGILFLYTKEENTDFGMCLGVGLGS